MSTRRSTVILTILLAIAIGTMVYVMCAKAWEGIEIAFAEEQLEVFHGMRRRALAADPGEAAQCLQYALHYYPSGSKQTKGSRLDRIVERARAEAVRDIVEHLQSKTGDNLGDDPQAWIRKYAESPTTQRK